MNESKRNKKMIFIFNHHPTEDQIADARAAFGIASIIEMPPDIKAVWQQIPSDVPLIAPTLEPVKKWLTQNSDQGDIVLIQGDFGATFLMVNFAMESGLMPVYATTKREASEVQHADGTIRTAHLFRHQRFRLYGN